MTRSEVIEQIVAQRREGHCFIKTWGTGHKLVDFELIDRFMQQAGAGDRIEGFELLDIEQMWQILIDLDPDRLIRVKREESEVIEWIWSDSDGTERKTVYPFSPEGIMTIIDDEFFA